jgi:outer membrane lipoprotein carrier protein
MEILEGAAARYAEIEGLCAQFEQTLEVTLLERRVDSAGELCQEGPDLFSMRFTDPEGDLVVADGEWIWVYYPSTDPRQVMRAPLGSGAGRFDFHSEFLDRPREKYRAAVVGEERIGGVATTVLTLDPIASSPFQRATLWVDASRGLILQLLTEEENGSVRTVRLSDLRLNPEIPSEIFRFEPPAGADVITRG